MAVSTAESLWFVRLRNVLPWFLSLLLLPLGTTSSSSEEVVARRQRVVPSTVLIGYAQRCDDRVVEAVERGVNVVVWAFGRFEVDDDDDGVVVVRGGPDHACVRRVRARAGVGTTLHLLSFGGWNGPRPDGDRIDARDALDAWRSFDPRGDVFDGVDWDLEGHDGVAHPNNYLPPACLALVGELSALLRADGLVVTAAPPQSYLDVHDPRYSRYLNLTRPELPSPPPGFSYYGANAYAQLLHHHGDAIDLVSIQLYESYSRAMAHVETWRTTDATTYLTDYVERFATPGAYRVDGLGPNGETVAVHIPPSKLVLGLAGPYAKGSDRTLYVDPRDAGEALVRTAPGTLRGLMFWSLHSQDRTSTNRFVSTLNEYLNVRRGRGRARARGRFEKRGSLV